MASAKEYAEWIVSNQDKKGTDEFDTVATAYEQAKGMESSPPEPDAEPAPSPTATEIGMNQSRERERLKDVPVTRDFGNRNIQSGNLVQAGFTGESLGPENKYQITP